MPGHHGLMSLGTEPACQLYMHMTSRVNRPCMCQRATQAIITHFFKQLLLYSGHVLAGPHGNGIDCCTSEPKVSAEDISQVSAAALQLLASYLLQEAEQPGAGQHASPTCTARFQHLSSRDVWNSLLDWYSCSSMKVACLSKTCGPGLGCSRASSCRQKSLPSPECSQLIGISLNAYAWWIRPCWSMNNIPWTFWS